MTDADLIIIFILLRFGMDRVQDHPPTLDLQTSQHKYSKALKEMIDACLAKDPAKRPSAAELLASGLFRAGNVKRKGYLGAVLSTFPSFLTIIRVLV